MALGPCKTGDSVPVAFHALYSTIIPRLVSRDIMATLNRQADKKSYFWGFVQVAYTPTVLFSYISSFFVVEMEG
jgi:hypothetical protein